MRVPIKIVYTHIPDTWRSWKWDLVGRLLPFTLVVILVWAGHNPAWLGISLGNIGAQLLFAGVGAPLLFVLAMLVKLCLARLAKQIVVPADVCDASFQSFFYFLNGPIEEALFRGLLQGGLGVAVPWAPVGVIVGTAFYTLYHKIAWPWRETAATLLVGIPVALAFRFLPGPPSLLGVSIVHIFATCGFLGPGPYLLKKFGLVP